MTHHKLANEGELREKVRHIMYDAHINRHWACNAGCGVHEGTGSPMVQMMQILTSEIEKAKVEACLEEREEVALDSYKGQTFSNSTNYEGKFERFVNNNEKRIAQLSKLQEEQK